MSLTKKEAETLINAIKSFVVEPMTDSSKPAPAGKTAPMQEATRRDIPSEPSTAGAFDDPSIERMYHAFKSRLLAELPIDPIALHLVTSRPELIVEIEPRVIKLEDDGSVRSRLARLLADGFFLEPRRQGTARSELARTGSLPNSGQITTLFSDFVRDGLLVRDGDDYRQAPNLKITKKEIVTA